MSTDCEHYSQSVEASALTDLIAELRHRNFWLYQWGPDHDIAALGMVRSWSGRREIDVVVLWEDESATGYRTLHYVDNLSMFRPEIVSWQYHHNDPRWVFRAVYALPCPGTPGAPDNHMESLDPAYWIPEDLPDPLKLRPLGIRGQ